MAKKIVICTPSWCPDCRTAKKFLLSRELPHEEIEIEEAIVSGNKFHPSRFEKDLRDSGALGRVTGARKAGTPPPPG
jgi:glutaredoxin-related protein